MKKFFLYFLLFLVLIIAALSVVISIQPGEYRVERSATITGSVTDVFANVNDFRKWDAWSPWVKIDPNAKMTHEGKESGEGAVVKWDGNKDVGKGSMTITESKANERIKIKLAFLEPMPGDADVVFTFREEGEKTVVTWGMTGENGFLGKAMCMVFDMEKMIGEKYQEGLANLKTVVETKKKDNDGK
jgi:hypothetical protein